jgi:hypothetical protein
LASAFAVDQGGLDQCSDVKIGVIRQLAATTVKAEMLWAEMMDGKPVSVAELCSLASTAVRLSSRLGLERRQKDVPVLAEYLASLRQPEAAEEGEEGDLDDD